MLYIPAALCILSALAYWQGREKAFALSSKARQGEGTKLHSRPTYYGLLTAFWCGTPGLLLYLFWLMTSDWILTGFVLRTLPEDMQSRSLDQLNLLLNDLHNLIAGHVAAGDVEPAMLAAADFYHRLEFISSVALAVLILSTSIMAFVLVYRRIRPALRARNQVERLIRYALIGCSTLAIFCTVGIVLSVLFESIRFFQHISVPDFLFGLKWSPQMAMRADQAGSSGSFGAVPVMAGTFMITAIAMLVAVPVGLLSAVYLSEYAGHTFRAVVKPLLEILAGIPTVVYGFFAALIVAPFIRQAGTFIGLDVSSESALAAGLVMGIMIIPFVSSLSDDVINAVPQALRDGSYGLGATKNETVMQVVLPAALPGIVGGVLLAVSRAIGETMIVVMAAGLSARLTANPLETVTTVTVQIVTLLVGDQEFDSPKTMAAFALGLLLFIVTLALNVIALYIVRKYREEYE
ncbi:MAG: phosphate ABC transporter permease subunit PstC [Candidatus Electrothrix sp. GW3-4]|uniref:phosphate ABC transporter permease subunit PstC n=1 Tax=Candidatus Electrothrix sp. GW3-4 TaxID=3126740 RepID=UPI0030CEB03D